MKAIDKKTVRKTIKSLKMEKKTAQPTKGKNKKKARY